MDTEENSDNEVIVNYRSINCRKARDARTIKKNKKISEQNEEKAYNEIYGNLKLERKKQMKLLELAQMSKEVDDIKKQLTKITVIKPIEPQVVKHRSFFN